MAFLDGAPPERLCQPMVNYFTQRGGEVKFNARVKDIVLNDDGSVKHYQLVSGEKVEGDVYMSAMPGGCVGSGGMSCAWDGLGGGWWGPQARICLHGRGGPACCAAAGADADVYHVAALALAAFFTTPCKATRRPLAPTPTSHPFPLDRHRQAAAAHVMLPQRSTAQHDTSRTVDTL
jgi:hypothetical protein